MKTILLLIFALLFLNGSSQLPDSAEMVAVLSPVPDVGSHTGQNEGFKKIAKAIGEKKVVVLGEQNHGDANTLEAKTRLVKYLHQHHGFRAVIFESDFFAFERLKDIDSLQQQIQIFWGRTNVMQPLWNYIKKHNATLQLAAFRLPGDASYSKREFPAYIMQLLKRNKSLPSGLNASLIQAALKFQKDTARMVLDYLKNINTKKLTSFDKQVLKAFKNQLQLTLSNTGLEYYLAENLQWLLQNRFKNQKVIIWMASYHAIKNLRTVIANEPERLHRYDSIPDKKWILPAIQTLTQAMKKEVYVLNFIAAGGEHTPRAWISITNDNEKIETASHQIEALIKRLPHPFYFTDLSRLPESHPLSGEFYMTGYLHGKPLKAKWKDVFDGLFFIKEMKGLH